MAGAKPIQTQEKPGGVDYSASRKDVIEHSRKKGNGSDAVMVNLNRLLDRIFNSPVEETKAAGKIE